MIIVLGRAEDPCCQLLLEELSRVRREALFLPEDQLFPQLGFTWTPSDQGMPGMVAYGHQQTNFADIDGMLCRGYGIPVPPEDFDTKDGQYISAEWNALVMAWLHSLPCPVVNRLRPELWYKMSLNVPDLISLVPGLRFRLPRTLITTRSDDARAFCRSIARMVHYAPLTQPIQYPMRDEKDLDKLTALCGLLPFQLTECVRGKALDALVVGDEVMLVRPDGVIHQPMAVPVEMHCTEIGKALGLDFYRLSLVETPDGDWYCLGLDRMPSLYGYRPEVQLEIARRLAGRLVSGER